jgi:hypothetical protein
MTNLSPAAQTVLTASAKAQCLYEWSTVNDPPCHPSDQEWNGCGDCVKRPAIAAALRAAAQQVIEEIEPVEALINIAAELEGQ